MRDIVLGSVLLLSLIASVYSAHSFFKTLHSMPEEAGTYLRRAAMIVSLSVVGLLTVMAVLCLIFLQEYIGTELVVFFSIAYAAAAVIVYFAARGSRYPGTLGNVHKRIIVELVIYSAVFLIIFAMFMFGVFTAK